MCTNYRPSARQELQDIFDAPLPSELTWPAETYQDYLAPIILPKAGGGRTSVLAAYSMVPKKHIPPGAKRYSTLNARSETIGQLRSYASAWKTGQLCLIPMRGFYEPCYETGAAVRWDIGMEGEKDFAVAGLWRMWAEPDGTQSHAFTQLTINADEHPLMKRFHKPEDEKRSLVIVAPDEFDAWLNCRDLEIARSFLHLYPAELMRASPAPKPTKQSTQESLF